MIKAKESNNHKEWCEAVSQDLQQIAVLHDREASEELISALREVKFPYNLGFSIASEKSTDSDQFLLAQQFMRDALQGLPKQIDQQTLDTLAVDYADIYLNHSLHASPFESVWLDEDHLIQQEPMFKIRNWYKRYGLASSDWRVRSDDHLVLQLQFIAWLIEPESLSSEAIPLQNRLKDAAKFMDEHLLLWLADFSNLVAQRCETEFYASAVVLTHAYIDQLRDVLAEVSGQARPTAEESAEIKLKASQTVVEEPVSFMPGVAESW